MNDKYEAEMIAWKARHGLPATDAEAPDPEAVMVADDAKRKGKCYCMHCGEEFAICDMRLVTRRDDPYLQFDEETPANRPDWYIQVQHRVRMCKPCFKSEYEDDQEQSTGRNL